MKRKFTLLTSFTLLILSITANSQVIEGGYRPCGTDQMVAASLAANPLLKAQYEEEQRKAEEADRIAFQQGYPLQNNRSAGNVSAQQSPPQYIIPIVFHIIHEYGSENISDAQVLDAMRILNQDYRKLNADTSIIVPTFQGIAADAQIEFRLAQLDPNGNCTNGIDRIYSSETNVGDDGSKLNYWNRARYLNVWVVKAISNGAAGYVGCTFIMSYPSTEYTIHGINGDINFHISIGLIPFSILTVILGFFMSLGKAAVYKHIPVYFPENVGSVGGVVGLIGGLGGFVLPITFGFMNDLIQVWTSCFMLLFAITAIALIWMHLTILHLEGKSIPGTDKSRYLPELKDVPKKM